MAENKDSQAAFMEAVGSIKEYAKVNGNIVTRDEILNEVWGYEKSVSTNVVEVYIRYLRNKLPDIKIETIRGIGYRLI